MTVVTACIALGSNLGDRRGVIDAALKAIGQLDHVEIVAVSTIIETPPMGQPNQGDYLNAAATLRTSIDPRQLLDHFLAIETAHGRRRTTRTRWGSRELDIDLLLYGDRIISEPGLDVPHPHMHERAFVLEPLAQIAPDAMHPVLGRTIAQLLTEWRKRASGENHGEQPRPPSPQCNAGV